MLKDLGLGKVLLAIVKSISMMLSDWWMPLSTINNITSKLAIQRDPGILVYDPAEIYTALLETPAFSWNWCKNL
jgi:hypothetical protein